MGDAMRYRVTHAATIPAGVLGLTEAQAATRAHALRALGHGQYEVLSPVQFKVGEHIQLDGTAAKGLLKLIAQDPLPKAAKG